MKPRKTLASVSHQLNDLVSSMEATPLYFSAPYDNRQNFDVVSEKVTGLVESHKRVLGWVGIRKTKDDEYKIGVVVYPDEATRTKSEKKGVSYDRVCF